VTDSLGAGGIALAAQALPRAYRDGADLGGPGADGAGGALERDYVGETPAWGQCMDSPAAPLGANFPVPHGVVCAALLPHVIAANVRALRSQSAQHSTLARYARDRAGAQRAGRRWMMHRPSKRASVFTRRSWVRDLKIPAPEDFRHDRVGYPGDDRPGPQVQQYALNPVTLSDEALSEVLRGGIEGTAPLS